MSQRYGALSVRYIVEPDRRPLSRTQAIFSDNPRVTAPGRMSGQTFRVVPAIRDAAPALGGNLSGAI